jgi:hypothetical protein
MLQIVCSTTFKHIGGFWLLVDGLNLVIILKLEHEEHAPN